MCGMLGTHGTQRTVAGTTLMIVYGYNLREDDNTFVDIARAAMPEFSAGFMPGAYLVDLLPFCGSRFHSCVTCLLSGHTVRYIPSWIPGMGWKKLAKTWKHDLNAVLEIPYQFTKQEMVRLHFSVARVRSAHNGIPPIRQTAASSLRLYLFVSVNRRTQNERSL